MATTRLTLDDGTYTWYAFVGRSGDAGRRWAERYLQPDLRGLRDDIQRALELLRARRLEAGRAVLGEVWDAIEDLGDETVALDAVMRRWYFTAHAYVRYLEGDYAGATAELDRAQEEVEAAVTRAPFLLPLAMNCPELRGQHLRIARNRRQWDLMRRQIRELEALMAGHSPLCRLGDGTTVGFDRISAYLLSLDDLEAPERAAVARLLNPEARLRRLRELLVDVCQLPGFVIPYP